MSLAPSKFRATFSIFSLMIACLLLMAASCEKKQKINPQEMLEVVEASYVKNVPGVQSNLRSTTNYTIELKGSLPAPVTIKHVLVKEVILPLRSSNLNGEDRKDGKLSAGDVASLKIWAAHNRYESQSERKMVDEIDYKKSGKDLGERAEVVFVDEAGNEYVYSIAQLEKKDSIYHP